MLKRPTKVDFSQAEVGDKVTDILWGRGTIIKIDAAEGVRYPVLVEFVGSKAYTFEGLRSTGHPSASLFYGHFDGFPTEENLQPPVRFKKGDKVMVSDTVGVWFRRYFHSVDAAGRFRAYPNGADGWSTRKSVSWHECRKPTEEELKDA